MSDTETPMNPSHPVRVADIAARTLAAHGATHAFGMPGGEIVTFVDALQQAGLRFVLCRHENSAAFMAAGASTMTGAPGVLVTTLGPGLANAVNGVADAAQERIPLVVVSGVLDVELRGRYTHQIFDQQALLRSLVKGSFEIGPEGAGAVMARAVRLALTPPMGPVHIDIAPSVAARAAHGLDRVVMPTVQVRPGPNRDDPAVADLARRLATAARPLILAGFEAARTPRASAALRSLAEAVGAPVVTTYKGKGVIDETHPTSLGGAGLSPRADPVLLAIARAADVVVLAGYDPIEVRPGWLDPFSPDAHVVELSAAPVDHGMHDTTLTLQCDLAHALEALVAAAPRKPAATWSDGAPEHAKARLADLFAPPTSWGPHAVFAAIEAAAPPDAILTADSGAHRILLSQQMRIRRPLGLLQSNGLSTMACAIPLAAGVKAVRPDAPVIAMLGDGGLEMGLGELATLRDEHLPIVVVCLQDESLALIELKQAKMGLPKSGVSLGATRFEDIAIAMGGHGVRVRSRDELSRALAEAMTRPTYTLIVCEIEASAYVDRI
ncbi:MAG: thiamine pyrophosphate-binding protein [Hyphomicrobiaceae bacterium]|nr:thiamine pyrophosphate-binding protein [Hyphomicrobiaceae bacterium]